MDMISLDLKTSLILIVYAYVNQTIYNFVSKLI